MAPAKEFPLQKLTTVSGEIPDSIKGSLYRNGPGRVERGGQVTEHWFDGDGAILGVHFENGQAYATYKYIQSEMYKEEEAAGKYIYAGYGSKMNVPFWKRPLIQKFKNPGNTSVQVLPDKLLALYEGGLPYSLDPETLETHKMDDLGFLLEHESLSAHPKVDPETQEVYNFGIKKGPKFELCAYKFSKEGKLIKRNNVPVRFNNIHDCVIAGRYLIVMNFATKFEKLIPALLGFGTLKDCVKAAPELGTEVYVFDRSDMSLVKNFTMDPFFSYHFTNGYEEKDGNVYIEFVRHHSHEEFHDWASSLHHFDQPTPEEPNTSLAYMRINVQEGKLLETQDILDIGAEFPCVADAKVGKQWRYTTFTTGGSQNDHATDKQVGAIARYDQKTQKMQMFEHGKDKYCSEPAMASFKEDPENGHLFTVVYDAAAHSSELWIHDTRNFEDEPICKLALPEVVPLGFHGKWQAK
jgi:carotenoid cleavage dioxygenase-like enzyme